MSKFSAENKLNVKHLDLEGLVHKSKLGGKEECDTFRLERQLFNGY